MKLTVYLLTLFTTLGSLQLFAADSLQLFAADSNEKMSEPVEEEVIPIDETQREEAEGRLLNELEERLRAIYATFTQHSEQLQRFLNGDEGRKNYKFLSYGRVICAIFMLDFAGLYHEMLARSGIGVLRGETHPFFEDIIKIISEVLGLRLEGIQAEVKNKQESLLGLIPIQEDYFFTFIKQLFGGFGYEMLTCATFASALPFVSYQDFLDSRHRLTYDFFKFLINSYKRFKNINWASLCIRNPHWNDSPNVPALVFNFQNGHAYFSFFYRIQFLILKGASLQAALEADKAFLSKVLQRILKADWMREDHFFRILQLLLERDSDGIGGDFKLNGPYQDDALTLFEYAIDEEWPLDIIDLILRSGCNYQSAFCNSAYDGLLGKLLSQDGPMRVYGRAIFRRVLQIHFREFLSLQNGSITISEEEIEGCMELIDSMPTLKQIPWDQDFYKWMWRLKPQLMMVFLLLIEFYPIELVEELMILLAPYDEGSREKILDAIKKVLNIENGNMLIIADSSQLPQNQTVSSGESPDDDNSGGGIMQEGPLMPYISDPEFSYWGSLWWGSFEVGSTFRYHL